MFLPPWIGNSWKKKILVIDYDQYFLKNTKQSLEQIGNFAVTTVSYIDDALHLVDHLPFDAIISDNDRIRGIDLLKFLREKNDTTPFISSLQKDVKKIWLMPLIVAQIFISIKVNIQHRNLLNL